VVHTSLATHLVEPISDMPSFYARENATVPVYVPEYCITDITEGEHGSYDFDWQVMYEEILKLAKSIRH
jgi:hypothetical protein